MFLPVPGGSVVEKDAETGLHEEPASPTGERSRSKGLARSRSIALFMSCLLFALTLGACDPLTVHKVTTTIFDGVPSMPPAEEYCREYHQMALSEERSKELKLALTKQGVSESQHPPYAEKRCNDCHDKNTESGFVVPPEELCGHCHKGFPSTQFVHGPVAVGACQKCHLPHNSPNPSLLIKPKGEICSLCHTEPRVAQAMHAKVTATGMLCTDCHDPHGGNNHYFLR
jgi:predicted CXXCH cytochrome family protein